MINYSEQFVEKLSQMKNEYRLIEIEKIKNLIIKKPN